MRVPRRYDIYLQDMVTSMDKIFSYIEGHDLESFQHNFMVIDAVARNFAIIGEAAGRIPKEIQDKYPEIPWQKMYQLRNIVSHAYFEVDHETLWGIATKNLPENARDLKEIISKEKK